jgi:hypothetical protein
MVVVTRRRGYDDIYLTLVAGLQCAGVRYRSHRSCCSAVQCPSSTTNSFGRVVDKCIITARGIRVWTIDIRRHCAVTSHDPVPALSVTSSVPSSFDSGVWCQLLSLLCCYTEPTRNLLRLLRSNHMHSFLLYMSSDQADRRRVRLD